MFPTRYFNPRYWAQRYWPKLGAEPPEFPTCDSGGYSRIFNFPTGGDTEIQNLSGGQTPIVQLSGGYSRIINIPTGGESTIEQNSGGESPLCQ